MTSCKKRFCICVIVAIPLVFACVVALFCFMILYNQNMVSSSYQDQPESRFFAGGKNESYYHSYIETFIAADLDRTSFDKYAESSGKDFFQIDEKGFDIHRFNFGQENPSQEGLPSEVECQNGNWHIHHVNKGFFCVENQDDVRAVWITVYDTENERIYRHRYDKW